MGLLFMLRVNELKFFRITEFIYASQDFSGWIETVTWTWGKDSDRNVAEFKALVIKSHEKCSQKSWETTGHRCWNNVEMK